MELQATRYDGSKIASKKTRAGQWKKKYPGKWSCPLQELLVGEFLITPLTSVKMIRGEETSMNVRLRNYIQRCGKLDYALFSIGTRSGEQLATLGLSRDRNRWQFDRCFGPGHSEVMEESFEYLDDDGDPQTEWYATELFYVSHEVVKLMNLSNVVCH